MPTVDRAHMIGYLEFSMPGKLILLFDGSQTPLVNFRNSYISKRFTEKI